MEDKIVASRKVRAINGHSIEVTVWSDGMVRIFNQIGCNELLSKAGAKKLAKILTGSEPGKE